MGELRLYLFENDVDFTFIQTKEYNQLSNDVFSTSLLIYLARCRRSGSCLLCELIKYEFEPLSVQTVNCNYDYYYSLFI